MFSSHTPNTCFSPNFPGPQTHKEMDYAHFSREISMALIFDIYPRAAGAKLGRKVRVTSGSAAFSQTSKFSQNYNRSTQRYHHIWDFQSNFVTKPFVPAKSSWAGGAQRLDKGELLGGHRAAAVVTASLQTLLVVPHPPSSALQVVPHPPSQLKGGELRWQIGCDQVWFQLPTTVQSQCPATLELLC